MRRVTEEELAFYDRVAERISILLGQPQCPLTQSSLAERIGWNRASLCNFINRIDKSVAAHFVPRIARALQVPVEQLMVGKPAAGIERKSWDPRWDEPQVMVDKLAEWKERKPAISLHRILPAWLMPTRAMLVNYIDSIFDGASPVAAERWHELAESRKAVFAEEAQSDVSGSQIIMFLGDLRRIAERAAPYHGFSAEEVVCLLEHLKKEWVRNRNFRLIAAPDSARTADLRLEWAGNRSLTAIGREVRIECRDDFRIHWSEDPNAVALTRECLGRLKKSAGLGAREDPSPQEIVRVLDDLRSRVDEDETDLCIEPGTMVLHHASGRRAPSSFATLAGAREERVVRQSQRMASPTF